MLKKNPRRIVWVFHRVAEQKNNRDNPFSRLSNLTPGRFKTLIRLLGLQADYVDLDTLLCQEQLDSLRMFLHLTFDDVSSSFLSEVLPFIEKHNIPVTLFPSAVNAEYGYSWRDKLYYILERQDLRAPFIREAKSAFGDKDFILENDIYRWSKRADLDQRILEKEVIDVVLERSMDDFLEKVNTHKPYLDWKELRGLGEHRLITLGNHSFSHYDYRSIPKDDTEKDIRESHNLIKDKTGITCRHFAVPFGSIDQKTYLTCDGILEKMGYQTVGWGKRVNNPRMQPDVLNHYFRIDGAQSLLVNVIKQIKTARKTQYSPLGGIPFSYEAQSEAPARLVRDVPLQEYKHFFRRIQPQKFHFQNDEFLDYLFYKNPFRRTKPLHFAIKVGEDIYAVASSIPVPFYYKGRSKEGVFFSSWYRFPTFPSQNLRAKALFEEAQKQADICNSYKPAPKTLDFYKNWDRVRIFRLLKRPKNSAPPSDRVPEWNTSAVWVPEIQKVIDPSHHDLLFSIKRGKEFLEWRLGRYPLCRFLYLLPKKEPVDWYAAVCLIRGRLYVSDFCLTSLANRDMMDNMLRTIIAYAQTNEMEEVYLETSNKLLVETAHQKGFETRESFFTLYLYPEASGKEIDWKNVHETQVSGDILPRPFAVS
ncbi:MAG: polysaccharide deacetylase family protein [Candidatus Aminicenantes bacterium]|nr:polysaccharide deacetylase family protein [Candidatus Aminicenantes bacterium]